MICESFILLSLIHLNSMICNVKRLSIYIFGLFLIRLWIFNLKSLTVSQINPIRKILSHHFAYVPIKLVWKDCLLIISGLWIVFRFRVEANYGVRFSIHGIISYFMSHLVVKVKFQGSGA